MLNFKAALFDLDGTLFDSMRVWAEVDEVFLGRRGIPIPADYAGAVSGMSFLEAARYTKARFGLPETIEEIGEEWHELTREEYAERVGLKPHAREYLRYLKRAGVRLAVTTALPEGLFAPALRRLGIYELFSAYCSTGDTGRGKADGEIFARAAKMLGVDPSDCVVFEDVYEGVVGAKAAGMGVYVMYDAASSERAWRAADGAVIRDFEEMYALHGRPEVKARCVILPAYGGKIAGMADISERDYLLCADGGYARALSEGLRPDAVIGDFDSMPEGAVAEGVEVIRYPAEKDDTDTMLCVKHAVAMGHEEIVIAGGVGGRLDHTLANLQAMCYAADRFVDIRLIDRDNEARLLIPGNYVLPKREGFKLSLLAHSDECRGVTVEGAAYPLRDAVLTNAFPLGVSNEFAEDEVALSFRSGRLMVFYSKD